MKTYISSHNTTNSKTKDSSGIGSLYSIGKRRFPFSLAVISYF